MSLRYLFIVFIILLSHTGCTSQDDEPVYDNSISFVSKEKKGEGNRAGASSFFKEGDAFGVFGSYFTDLASQTAVFDNEKVSWKANKWTYAVPRLWEKGKKYRFRAVFPYADQSPTSPYVVKNTFGEQDKCEIANFIVEDEVSKQMDLLLSDMVERDLTAEDVQLSLQPPVAFTFQHLLTKVNVKLKLEKAKFDDMANTNKYTNLKVTKLYVQLYGMKTKGTYQSHLATPWETGYSEPNQVGFTKVFPNEQTGAKDNLLGTEPITVIDVWHTESTGSGTLAEDGLLMIPQDVTGIKLRVDFILNYTDNKGKPAQKKMDNVLSVPVKTPWGIGKQIVYTATLDPALKIKFTAPQVEPWSEAKNSNSVIIK